MGVICCPRNYWNRWLRNLLLQWMRVYRYRNNVSINSPKSLSAKCSVSCPLFQSIRNSSGCSWTELQPNLWIAMKAGLHGQPFSMWIHNSWIVFLTIPELWFSQFKNCENHNVIILILIILIIVILILFYPFRNGIERKWPFMYNHRNQAIIAYSCECILKITASFAIIIHSKRESRNRR